MGSYFSRESGKELTGPVKYMYENYGASSVKCVATWVKITAGDGLLKFPQNGTFDRTRLDNLREKLSLRTDRNQHFNSLRSWTNESRCRHAESQIASLTDQNKRLIAQMEEKNNTTQTKAKPNSVSTNKKDKIKTLYPVKELKESSDDTSDETSDDDFLFECPRSEVNNQGEEGWDTVKRGRKSKRTKTSTLAPLITMGKDVVYKPWARRELKAIVGDFPKDVRKNKQKWLDEWDSVCTIYKPHMPDMMQLLKLTLPPNLKDKIIDVCDIPRNPTEFAQITTENAQSFYSIIALAVQQEVVQQSDFTPLTKIRQGKDDNPREIYEKFMITAKENCGLSQSQINDLPPGYLQNIFVSSLQPKIKEKVQLTVGWTGKSMEELVEIAQHHWDNTVQKEYKMHETLMFAQVSHYTGGATTGKRSGRGDGRGGKWGQRGGHSHLGQSNPSPFSNKGRDNCFFCGEPNHWVRNCPHKTSQPRHTLPTAPPSSLMEDQQTPQYNP